MKLPTLVPVVLLVGCLAVAANRASNSNPVDVGNFDLGGGSAEKFVDSSLFQGGGGSATKITGTFKNTSGRPITDLHISLKKRGTSGNPPTAGGVGAQGQSGTTSAVVDGVAGSVNGFSVSGNNSGSFEITGINAQGTSSMWVTLTPSYTDSIAGASHATNAITPFTFSQTSDSMRHGSKEVYHDVVVAELFNESEHAGIVSFSGRVFLPTSPSVTLEAVHLLDAKSGSAAVAGSTCSVDGVEFEANCGNKLDSDGHYLLVFELSAPLAGSTFRALVTANYE